MTTLFADTALLPHGFAADVRIDIEHGIISEVTVNSAAQPADEHIAGLLLPGMPNLHSHAFQRAFAGHSAFGGGDFWSWREAMYRTAARMTPEACAAITAWLGKELLKGGYTTLCEFHYLHHETDGAHYAPATAMADAVAAGAHQAGIGLTLLIGLYETAGFDRASLSGGQIRFRNDTTGALDMATRLRAAGIHTGLAVHSLRAVPPACLRSAVEAFAGGPIHIHAAEQRAEVQACIEALGAPPVAWLLDHAPVDERWCLIHATHATPPELAAAARAGATIGLCPTTEADLGDGIFPLPTLLQAGGDYGIGSDSNVALDAFAELRLLEYGQRLQNERRNLAAAGNGHTGTALWQAACRGGAKASRRAIGHIAPGHSADFIVIDPTPETETSSPDTMLAAAIFAASKPPVRHAMVDGAWLIRDGSHRNEAAMDAAYRAALRALAS